MTFPNLLLLASDSATAHVAGSTLHAVPGWVTSFYVLVLMAMVLCLAFEEKLHVKKSLLVGTFAGFCLISETVIGFFTDRAHPMLPFGAITLPNGHSLNVPIFIPAIDWSVITIILGASLFVEVTSRSGIFTWLAIKLTKQSGGDPWRLLLFYGGLTVVFSAVLNNVTAMIIIGSLTTVSLSKLQRRDLLLGFLLTEGLLTNVGGLLTLISSVPNIIVGQTAGIGFGRFFLVAAPYVLVASIVTLLQARLTFGVRSLGTPEEQSAAAEQVAGFDETENVPSARFFWASVGLLAGFIACLAGQSALPWDLDELGMGFVALFFAGRALWIYKHEVDAFYKAVDWDLLGFFASLFVVIYVMEQAEVLALIGRGIGVMLTLPASVAQGSLLASAAAASSVTDNIPLAAVLAKILAVEPTVIGESGSNPASPYWWSVIFGANLGGNITPIGSASTVVAMTIIHRQQLPLTFMGFVKRATPFALVQISLAVLYVWLYAFFA